MHIGGLNKRISFITMVKGPEKDAAGDTILIPITFKTVWASVNPASGKEIIETKKYQAEINYKITTRYFREGITPDMQIKYGLRFFNISDILDPFEAHKTFEITCTEKVYKNV